MTVTITKTCRCSMCEAAIGEPYTLTLWGDAEPNLPRMARHAWTYHHTPYDLCDACAEPMRVLFQKLYAAAYAKREADRALKEAAA